MKKSKQLFSRELRLISAFLDGELSGKDLKRAEILLSEHPEAASSFEELQQIKRVLKLLPTRKVPRNFTISEQVVRRLHLPALAVGLKYMSVVSAALLAVVLAFDFIIPYQSMSGEFGLARSAPEADVEEISTTNVEEVTPIITSPPLFSTTEDSSGFEGKGGGDESMDLQEEIPQSEELMAPMVEQAEEIPLESQEEMAMEPEQQQQFAEKLPQANGEETDRELISPDDDGEPLDEISDVFIFGSEANTLRILEYVLAGLSILAAFFAIFLRKRKK